MILRLFAVTVMCVAALDTATFAADPKLGEPMGPVDLLTHDGRKMTMRNYDERPATAVLFLSPRCPVTEKAINEIAALHQEYRRKNVLFVGIVPDPEVTNAELADFIQKRGVIFPLYRDPQGKIVKQFGASVTPEVFMLDGESKLIYHGGLADAAGHDALESRIRDVLAKKEITPKSDKALGSAIGAKLSPIKRDNPYGQLSFSSELVFEKIPQAAVHHCSVIEQAPNGDLLCVWYGGNYESGDDQMIFLARRKKGSRTWSEPEVLIEDALLPPGNAIIFVDGRKRLQMVWCRMEPTRPIRRGGGWDRCRLMLRTSEDSGRTWSKDREMFDEDLWAVPRNRPLTLRDGTIVLPVEAVVDGRDGSTFLISRDDGDSWKIGGFTTGGSQPALAEREDGSLVALMRKYPQITEIISQDQGETWSEAKPTTLNNPDSGISMIPMANGHWVIVYNDSKNSRTPLSIARSTDEGRTWEAPLKLEANPGEYSYPSLLQTADGKIHVTYTFRRYGIKHVELNEDWLVHMERPN
ncbi:AhpC/TSA family protein [Symmachiella macrocystis]|uniref:AhpC/TSA family protein n=1 Tax=Symmachiella macrocystis TaxID=2527985 RepID=A0A5C6BAR7_9PLAN|nr:exo-alpha-sialidase [Symmachiella macrocystis]TWU09183.1 AhpC/TSA family protein [Symmachiella macrocystis]